MPNIVNIKILPSGMEWKCMSVMICKISLLTPESDKQLISPHSIIPK